MWVVCKLVDVFDIEAACVDPPMYHNIDDVISHSLEYEVIHADQFATTDKSKRYFFFKNLQLSRSVQLYRYHQSGSLGTLNFVWVVPGDHRQRKHSKMVATIEEIKQNMPTYHTRSMRREFKEKFSCVAKIPPVVLTEMYRTLTSDCTAVPNPEISNQFIDAEYDYLSDTSIVVDLRHLNEGKSASVDDDELDCLFSFAKLIDPDVSRDMTTKKELSGRKKYQEFLGTHAIAHHYFQIKKCGSSTCKYCSPPRCPPAVFQGLSFLPDPLLDSSGSHFKLFDDIYGKVPNSKKDRPSAGTLLERIDKENKDILVSTKARMIVICCQCNKPRVVYSPLRLQPEVERYVHDLADFIQYSCGSPLYYELPESWSLEMTQNARQNMTCSTAVEFSYYSCRKFPDVCAHCGDNDCCIVEELKNAFKTVLPICHGCKTTKEPVTRGRYKHATSNCLNASASKKARLSV